MSKLIKKALIAVGRPRCGKKTHLQYLADQLEAPYIDMGAHLRELKTKLRLEGTERPELAPLVSTGYVADEFIMSIFRTWIGQERRLKSPFIILDGVPRNIAQARLVLPFLKHNGGFEIHTLWFTTSAKACMERPTRGERDDDSADKIVARMKDFESLTQPMLGLMKTRTNLLEIDNSDREIHAVREEITKFLGVRQILQAVA